MYNETDIKNSCVGELVVNNPSLEQVFESFNIDYCCHGDRNLTEATLAANKDLAAVLIAIEKAIKNDHTKNTTHVWAEDNLGELVTYIENTHHTYTREALLRLEALSKKVLEAHESTHGALIEQVKSTFLDLKTELELHLMKEEQILFPYIRKMDASIKESNTIPIMHCGSVQHPIRQMKEEHKETGSALEKIKTFTNNYTTPENTCLTFKALFNGLKELEADLHKHIHLENNILFPLVTSIEKKYEC